MMKCASMLPLAAMLFVALSVVPPASAFCYHGKATLNENFEVVCYVPHFDIPLHVGQHLVTSACHNCSCSVDGFNCCALGMYAGDNPELPEGYEGVVLGNCTAVRVPIPTEGDDALELSGSVSEEDHSLEDVLGDRRSVSQEDFSWEDILGDRRSVSQEDFSWEDILGDRRSVSQEDFSWEDVLGDRRSVSQEDFSWEDILGDRRSVSQEDFSWEDILGDRRSVSQEGLSLEDILSDKKRR